MTDRDVDDVEAERQEEDRIVRRTPQACEPHDQEKHLSESGAA